MIKPQEMTKVIIAVQKDSAQEVIKCMHKLKTVHIKEHKSNEYADIGNPLPKASQISGVLVKIRALSSLFSKTLKSKEDLSTKIKTNIGLDAKKINEKVDALQLEINTKQEKIKSIESRIEKNTQMITGLNSLKGINIPIEFFSEYKSIAYFVGNLKDNGRIEEKIKNITGRFSVIRSKEDGSSLIVLLVESSKKKEASEILNNLKFSPINLMQFEGLKGTAEENISKISFENNGLLKSSEFIKFSIEKLMKENYDFIISSEMIFAEELDVAEAALKFAETKDTFVITGWVPAENKKEFEEKIKKASKDIFIKFSAPGQKENTPVKLKNPKMVEPFEFFLNLYTLPSYKEIDPTFIIFLTFPLLFGFILGDIGYGITTLVLFLILRKIMPKAKGFLNILVLSSLATIFFGFVFGEFFGLEEVGTIHLQHLLSRSENEGIINLLGLSFLVGVVHINIGLLIGFFNEKKSHGALHALFAKGGWIVLQIAIALIAFVKTVPSYVGYSLLGLSVLMLLKGEGIKGLLEIPSIFGNIISYARLMAIGVTSVLLALVINELAKNMFHSGPIMFAAGVLVLAAGHAINIAIGILGSFLHPLRLHYVEFFSKFFQGGGQKYSPFGLREV